MDKGIKELLINIIDNPISLVALGALATSLVSIILAIVPSRRQKIHNHKSLKPIAEFILGFYTKDHYLYLTNKGVGPLIIKEFWFRGEEVNTSDFSELVDIDITFDLNSNLNEYTIQPNKNICLFHYRFYVTRDKYDKINDPEEEKKRLK